VCPTKSITDKGGIYKIDKTTCNECEGEFDEPQCLVACPAGEACIVPLAV
jgi:Fe-S-cluster-containing hydrogenase component 2